MYADSYRKNYNTITHFQTYESSFCTIIYK